jgi:hypothetical protein
VPQTFHESEHNERKDFVCHTLSALDTKDVVHLFDAVAGTVRYRNIVESGSSVRRRSLHQLMLSASGRVDRERELEVDAEAIGDERVGVV